MTPVLAGGRRAQFAGLLAVAGGRAAVAVLLAWCVQHLFDRLTRHALAAPDSAPWIAAAVGAAGLLFLAEAGQRRLTEGLGASYTTDVRLTLFQHMLRLPPRSVLRRRPGVLMLPFVGDLTALRQWVSDGLARNVAALATTACLLIWLGFTSVWLSLAIGTTFLAFAALTLVLSRPLDQAVREVRRRRGALSGFVSGRLAAIATVASMGRERTEVRKAAERIAALNEAVIRRAWLVGSLRGLVHGGAALLALVTLLIGGLEVSANRMTAGEVVGALSLVSLLGGAMRDLGRAFELWIPGRVARGRIERILSEPVRSTGRKRRTKRTSDDRLLAIEDLCIGNVLGGVTAEAGPGEVILLEGPGGAGKSTLISAIAGLTPADRGRILLKGSRLADLSPARVRRALGLASPSVPLLPGTLGMNIRYGHPAASSEAVAELVAQLGLDTLLERQPDGLDTKIADVDAELSTGEHQALLIARALLGRPSLLLLDSVDSHLSPDVLIALAAIVRDYPGSVIMTATRPPLAALATTRWRLEEGRLRRSDGAPSLVPSPALSAGGKP